MSDYSHKTSGRQASAQPRCAFSAGEVLDMEAAMARHEGLIQAFIRRQGGGRISYAEGLQAGRIGLWRALRGYDATRGAAFSTYAWVVICRHIHQAVAELERERDDWQEGMGLLEEAPQPEAWVEQRLILEALSELVERLPERLRQVIVARYGLGGPGQRELKAVGAEPFVLRLTTGLGICAERVRQLQQEGLAWLRHPAHWVHLRQLLGHNTAAHYRQALAQNAALRRARRSKP